MSIREMNRVWTDAPHGEGTLLLLLALADFSNDDGLSWPKVSELASKIRMTERQTYNILNVLTEEGNLYIVRGRGRGRGSRYVVLVGLTEEQVRHRLTHVCNLAAAEIDAIVERRRKGAISSPFQKKSLYTRKQPASDRTQLVQTSQKPETDNTDDQDSQIAAPKTPDRGDIDPAPSEWAKPDIGDRETDSSAWAKPEIGDRENLKLATEKPEIGDNSCGDMPRPDAPGEIRSVMIQHDPSWGEEEEAVPPALVSAHATHAPRSENAPDKPGTHLTRIDRLPIPPPGHPAVSASLVRLWDQIQPGASQHEIDRLTALAAAHDQGSGGYGHYWLCRILMQARETNPRSPWRYVTAVLTRWQTDGYGSDAPTHRRRQTHAPPQPTLAETHSEAAESTAITLYETAFGLHPNAVQQQRIAETVTDLALWQAVLSDWQANGWKATSVARMLDRYTRQRTAATHDHADRDQVSDLPILLHPHLSDEERDAWIYRLRHAAPAERRGILDQFHQEHPDA